MAEHGTRRPYADRGLQRLIMAADGMRDVMSTVNMVVNRLVFRGAASKQEVPVVSSGIIA